GLRAAERERPAAVVLDLVMPRMDGFEFLDHFRRSAIGPQTPVIVWTVKELTEADRARLRATAQGVILKSRGGVAPLLEELRKHLRACPTGERGLELWVWDLRREQWPGNRS